MVEMCMIGIENEECVEEDSSTSMLWRNTDIYDSFPEILPRNSQDERNYMMKYETWRIWPNRVKDLPWCNKTLTFQKDACLLTLDNQTYQSHCHDMCNFLRIWQIKTSQ